MRNGSYARMFLRTLRDLFACDQLSADSLLEVSQKMRAGGISQPALGV